MHVISRRTLLKGSFAAGLATSAGCDLPWSSFNVNFICTGMFAFFVQPGGQQLKILIPKKEIDGKPVHLVRFGGIGGLDLPCGDYTLNLNITGTPNSFPGLHDQKNNVAFQKDQQNTALTPVAGGIYATIQLPMPAGVDHARIVTKKPGQESRQFFSGPDVDHFNIKPDQFPGVYVLRYYKVGGPVSLFDSKNPQDSTLMFPRENGTLNLHLYCEPPASPAEDHLCLFNNMFLKAADGKPLCLQHTDHDAEGICRPGETPPPGLSADDIKTLSELGVVKPPARQPFFTVADVAGCVNGWIDGAS
jgi:hypothetical protein